MPVAGSCSVDDRVQPAAKPAPGLFCGLALCLFVAALDQTILNTAIPRISTELNGFDRGPWIVAAYLLFATVIAPFAGKLADLYGVKSTLLVSTLCFLAASILCGMSGQLPAFGIDGMTQLILFRVVQGTAGGALLTLTFIAVGDLFPVLERGKHQGWLAAAFIAAALVGPILGGWLADHGVWRWIFYINVPVCIAAAICLQWFFPISSRQLATHNDPLIPRGLLGDRLVVISLLTVFVSGIALFGGSLLVAVLLQRVIGLSATDSGIILTPVTIVVAVASIFAGRYISKEGRYKSLCICGLALIAIGTLLLSTTGMGTAIWHLMLYCGIAGVGLGLLLPIHAILIQSSVHGSVLGVATSLTQFCRSLGGTFGTGIMTGLLFVLLKFVTLQSALSIVCVIYAVTVIMTILLNASLPEKALKSTTKCVLAGLAVLVSAWSLPASAAAVYERQCDAGVDLKIPVHKWSNPHNNPKGIVVAVPGLVFTGNAYDTLARYLSDRGFVVYSADMRGYGDWVTNSGQFDGDNLVHYTQTKDDLTRLLSWLRKKYPGKPVFCMGESFGANYSVWQASTHPELVDGVIASGLSYKIVINPRPLWVRTFFQGLRHPKKPLDLKPYLEPILTEDVEQTKARLAHNDAFATLSATDLIKAAITTKRAIRNLNLIPREMPILLVAGENDRIQKTHTYPDMLRQMGSSHVKVAVLKNRGHLLLEQKTLVPEVVGLVQEWLDQRVAESAARIEAKTL